LMKIKTDTWYTVAVVQNNLKKKYSVEVNGKLLCDDVYFTNTSFTKPISYSFSSPEGESEMWLDDIRVYSGSEIKPESYFEPMPDNKARDEKPVIETESFTEDRIHFVSDFNSEQTGGRPTGIDLFVGDGDVFIADIPDSKDKSIKISQQNSGNWIYLTDAFGLSDLVMEARVRTDSMNTDKLVFMIKDTNGLNMRTVVLSGNGFITAPSGKSLGKYTSRTWYDLAVVTHFAQKTVDYYVNGELILKDEPFAVSGFQTPSEIRTQILEGGNGDVLYVDNLKIYTGSQPRELVLEDDNILKTVDTSLSIFKDKPENGESLNGAVALLSDVITAYNGTKRISLDASPFISNSRMYVPIRFVTESFGGSVDWSETYKRATIRCEGNTVEFTSGSSTMIKNGTEVYISAGNKRTTFNALSLAKGAHSIGGLDPKTGQPLSYFTNNALVEDFVPIPLSFTSSKSHNEVDMDPTVKAVNMSGIIDQTHEFAKLSKRELRQKVATKQDYIELKQYIDNILAEGKRRVDINFFQYSLAFNLPEKFRYKIYDTEKFIAMFEGKVEQEVLDYIRPMGTHCDIRYKQFFDMDAKDGYHIMPASQTTLIRNTISGTSFAPGQIIAREIKAKKNN